MFAGDFSRRPTEKIAFGLAGLAGGLTAEADAGFARVESSRGAGFVDQDLGVVHDASVVRAQFDGANPASLLQSAGHDEVAEQIGAVGRHDERLGHFEHEIGLAHLPAIGKSRRGGRVRGVAFKSTGGKPRAQRVLRGFVETSLALEGQGLVRGDPRRHRSGVDALDNLSRAFLGVGEAQQGKRRDFAGAVAGGAVLLEQRRDVAVEGRRRGRNLQQRREGEGESEGHQCAPSFGIGQPIAGAKLSLG
jgi:hypothetical protein